jgi:hypothetical protein
MRTARTKVRLGTWVALLALTIQFALSFGHVHRLGIGFSAGPPWALAVQSDQGNSAVPERPATPKGLPGLAFDFCAICAATALAGNGLLASDPALALPSAVHAILFRLRPDSAATTSPQGLFRARAPPRA